MFRTRARIPVGRDQKDWYTNPNFRYFASTALTGVDRIRHNASCVCGGGCPSCAGPSLQRKAQISIPFDRLEREADNVAERVMRVPDPATLGQRRGLEEASASGTGAGDGPKIQRLAHGAGEVPSDVTSRLGAWAPLDTASRAYFEPRFGRDFGDVRIYSDHQADTAAASVQARAFTLGRDVVFAAGEHDPGSEGGRRLLAHELTHVVQQNGIARSIQRCNEPLAAPTEALAQSRRALRRPGLINQLRAACGLGDGTVDAELIAALPAFQASHDIGVTGVIDLVTLAEVPHILTPARLESAVAANADSPWLSDPIAATVIRNALCLDASTDTSLLTRRVAGFQALAASREAIDGRIGPLTLRQMGLGTSRGAVTSIDAVHLLRATGADVSRRNLPATGLSAAIAAHLHARPASRVRADGTIVGGPTGRMSLVVMLTSVLERLPAEERPDHERLAVALPGLGSETLAALAREELLIDAMALLLRPEAATIQVEAFELGVVDAAASALVYAVPHPTAGLVALGAALFRGAPPDVYGSAYPALDLARVYVRGAMGTSYDSLEEAYLTALLASPDSPPTWASVAEGVLATSGGVLNVDPARSLPPEPGAVAAVRAIVERVGSMWSTPYSGPRMGLSPASTIDSVGGARGGGGESASATAGDHTLAGGSAREVAAGATAMEAARANPLYAILVEEWPSTAARTLAPTFAEFISRVRVARFLGKPVMLHQLLLDRLARAEAYLLARHPGLTADQIGTDLEVNSAGPIGGASQFRLAVASRQSASLHQFGLAIDIDASRNPWIAETRERAARSSWISWRAALLIGGAEAVTPRSTSRIATGAGRLPRHDAATTTAIYAALALSDRALERYFTEDVTSLAASFSVAGRTPTEPSVIDPDHVNPAPLLAGDVDTWRATITADRLLWRTVSDRAPVLGLGLFDMSEQLVHALRDDDGGGLRWGGSDLGERESGDFMHFDIEPRELIELRDRVRTRLLAMSSPRRRR